MIRKICDLKDRTTGSNHTVAVTFGKIGEPVTVHLLKGAVEVEEFPFDPTYTQGTPLQNAACYRVVQVVYGEPVRTPESFPSAFILVVNE